VPRAEILPHRALSDCIVTAGILNWLMGRAKWSDMLQWSAEPPLITTCNLPKHRGKRYDAIAAEDPSYLTWIIEKSELDADTKWNASYWLERPKKAEKADEPAPPENVEVPKDEPRQRGGFFD
jgi:exodeoxyribonuclease X